MIPVTTEDIAALSESVTGPVLTRGDAGITAETSGQNLLISHDPDLVVGAATEADVIEAVQFARDHGLAVHVLATGHGTARAYTDGLLLTTKRLAGITIDPDTRLATIGAGARWRDVIAAAAPHDLAPVTGSSTSVGVVGFLLGGGLGPLARSHGFASDWVRGVHLVTGGGELVTANEAENADMFWAARGGRAGFGVITEVTIELAPIPALYAGSLLFDEANIAKAFRAWSRWTATAPDEVTTSAALMQMPPLDVIPEALRGRKLLSIRFAYAGSSEEGERIAAPLRNAADVYIDALGPLPLTDVARIHGDPDEPSAAHVWSNGHMFTELDDDLAERLLEHFGPTSRSPFTIVELRQLGSRTASDVPVGSAVGGRAGAFIFGAIGISPEKRDAFFAAAAAPFTASVDRWLSPETTVNFAGEAPLPELEPRAWAPETLERLAEIRTAHDPAGLFHAM